MENNLKVRVESVYNEYNSLLEDIAIDIERIKRTELLFFSNYIKKELLEIVTHFVETLTNLNDMEYDHLLAKYELLISKAEEVLLKMDESIKEKSK